MRFTLWLRIFVYTITLLVVSQALAFYLHTALIHGDMRRYFADAARSVVAELTDRTLDMVMTYTRIYSHGQNHMWLTNADGSPLPGRRFREDAVLGSVIKRWDQDGVTVLETAEDPRFWVVAPVRLREGTFSLSMSFGPPPEPLRHGFLIQLFAPVLVVSCALALWMAWSVSRPLRRLRDEVGEMSATGPECKVTVTGRDEIADVASAVNAMAESLARHVRAMRALVANISHELRSPLARANLALGIVEESLPPEYVEPGGNTDTGSAGAEDSRKRLSAKYLAALQEELSHMDTLIGTTLLTQKIEAQQECVHMEELEFSELCLSVWRRYAPMFQRGALVPAASVAPGFVVHGNRTLLLQLLTNLLDNCLKYTDKGGEVRLSLQERSGKCLLSVENTHERIDDSELNHIFDPFYRIDQATGTGVGLGLSLAQKTVALHGGEIMAVPTEIGLCICMQLPLARARGE